MLNFFPLEFFPIIITLFAGVLIYRSILGVRQGYNYTVERFGRYTRTLKPGFHLLIPFVDQVGMRINMMKTALDISSQEMLTKDKIRVKANGIGFYQIWDAARAAYEIKNLKTSILNLITTNLRNIVSDLEMNELMSFRKEINAHLLEVVNKSMITWGVKITNIDIKDIVPQQNMVDYVNQEMKKEREKHIQMLEAQRKGEAQILNEERAKQVATLELEVRKKIALQEAEAKELAVQAEARTAHIMSEAIAKGIVQAVNYLVAQKHMESLQDPAVTSKHKVALIPLESTHILETLGVGITDITKESVSKDPGIKRPRKKREG